MEVDILAVTKDRLKLCACGSQWFTGDDCCVAEATLSCKCELTAICANIYYGVARQLAQGCFMLKSRSDSVAEQRVAIRLVKHAAQ
jgi:hypothetical protein